jgi:hypothetical protein
MTQNSPTGYVRTLEQAEIDTEALKLKSLGMTYTKIGQIMGCTSQAASDRYHRALAAVPSDAVEELRKTMGEQIDMLLEVALEQALTGKRSLFAIDRCVTLMDRKARLHGLDAPSKSQIEVFTYEPGSIESQVAELAAILDGRESSLVDETISQT